MSESITWFVFSGSCSHRFKGKISNAGTCINGLNNITGQMLETAILASLEHPVTYNAINVIYTAQAEIVKQFQLKDLNLPLQQATEDSKVCIYIWAIWFVNLYKKFQKQCSNWLMLFVNLSFVIFNLKIAVKFLFFKVPTIFWWDNSYRNMVLIQSIIQLTRSVSKEFSAGCNETRGCYTEMLINE